MSIMDMVKKLKGPAIRSVLQIFLVAYIINAVIAGMFPEYVASLPLALSIPVFGALLLSNIGADWLMKGPLRGFL